MLDHPVPATADAPLRLLFVNQGPIGSAVQGHLATEAALRAGTRDVVGVQTRFARMPSWNRASRALGGEVPVLGRFDLDFHVPRWHITESVRGRRTIRRELNAYHADALHVSSHTAGLLLANIMRTVPTFLAVDAPVWAWHAMGIWRRVLPYSRLALAPSLVLERRAFMRAAAVLTFSKWAALGVRQACPTARVYVVPPGVDLQLFRPGVRAPRDRLRVLFVGGRFAQKGGYDLLEALGPVLGRSVDLDVVSGDAVPSVRGVRVHRLRAFAPELISLYQQADLLCLPTYGDALPWAILEAMACGTPVVATAVGAIPEALGDGRAGMLVRPGDISQLRDAIAELLDSVEKRAVIAEEALSCAREQYDARVQGRVLVDIIRRHA